MWSPFIHRICEHSLAASCAGSSDLEPPGGWGGGRRALEASWATTNCCKSPGQTRPDQTRQGCWNYINILLNSNVLSCSVTEGRGAGWVVGGHGSHIGTTSLLFDTSAGHPVWREWEWELHGYRGTTRDPTGLDYYTGYWDNIFFIFKNRI